MAELTKAQITALGKKSVSQLMEGIATFVPEAPVWQMVKTATSFKRDELVVVSEDKVAGWQYLKVPTELLEAAADDMEDGWVEALKDRTFTIKGDNPIVMVGIGVAVRAWAPDASRNQKGNPIAVGQRKVYATAV